MIKISSILYPHMVNNDKNPDIQDNSEIFLFFNKNIFDSGFIKI